MDPQSDISDFDDLLSMAEDVEPTKSTTKDKSPSAPANTPRRSSKSRSKTTRPNAPSSPTAKDSEAPPENSSQQRSDLTASTPLPPNSDDNFIRLACSCGYRMRLKPNKAGTKIKCPKCRTAVKVPYGSASSKIAANALGETSGFENLFEELSTQLQKDIDQLKENKSLSGIAFRSLRKSVEKVSSGRYDTDQVREAIDQLGESEDSRAYPLLEQLWEEEAANLQSAILAAMGQAKDPRGTLFLIRLLKNPIPEIRLASVQSLAFTEDSRIVALLVHYGKNHPELKYAVGDSLLKMKGYSVDPVIALLQSSDPEIMTDAVILLGRLKTPDAVKPLMEVFQNHPGPIQGHVAEAFGLIGEPKCIPAIVPLLKSSDDKVRVQTASALGRVPHPGCLKALIESLNDPNPEVKKRCAMALGEIGDKRAASALSKLLKDTQTEIKITAAEALGRIGDDQAVPYLIEMCHEDDEAVILKALGALRKIKNPASIEPLTKLLLHESSRVRQRAIDVLGQVGDAVVAEQLEGLLRNDRSEDVRAAAAKALGEIRDPGAVDRLIDALHDSFSVKCRAIVALGEIGEESALASLLAMLKDPAPEVRYHASQALAQMDHAVAVKSIEPLLTDSNAMVRRGAAKALETLGQGDAEALLGSSTKQGVRRFSQQFKNMLAAISPGEIADAIQHGSSAIKIGAVGILVLPVLAYGVFAYFSGSKSKVETVALMRRGFTASIDISDDGKTLVSGRTTGVVEVWDVSSNERMSIFKPQNLAGEILGVCIVPGGESLVLATTEKAGGFDRKSEKMLWMIDLHEQPIISFQASKDRTNFMLTDRSGLSSFWNTTNGQPIGVGAVTLPKEFTQQTQLANDASAIAASSKNSVVKMWSTKTIEELASFSVTEKSKAIELLFSPDDSLLAISDSAGYLTIYEIATEKTIYRTKNPEISYGRPVLHQNLSFSDDGNQLRGMRGVQLFQLDLDTSEMAVSKVDGLSTGVFGAQPNGSLFAIGSKDESDIHVFDRKTGKKTGSLNP